MFGKTLYQHFSRKWFQCSIEHWQDYLEDCPRYPEILEEYRERNVVSFIRKCLSWLMAQTKGELLFTPRMGRLAVAARGGGEALL